MQTCNEIKNGNLRKRNLVIHDKSTNIGFKCNKNYILRVNSEALIAKKTIVLDINLSYNLIMTYPFGFISRFTKLDKINLAYNRLKYIGMKAFINNKHLKHINIRHNKITDIHEQSFENNFKLQFIYLNYNLLVELKSGLFKNTKNLVEISIHDNKLKHIRGSWKHMTKLNRIVLYNNFLTEFSEQIFNLKSKKFHELILHNNKFTCEKDLVWTLEYKFEIINYYKDNFIGLCKYEKANIYNIYDFLDRNRSKYKFAKKYLINIKG